jgi:hypothetical protein
MDANVSVATGLISLEPVWSIAAGALTTLRVRSRVH